MAKRLVDYDPFTGIAHYVEWGDLDDALHYTAEQEADPIIEQNKLEASMAPARHGDGLTKVGSIPLTLWAELKRKGIIDDKKKLLAWLADPDHSKFRCR
jgi:hypothetical protein